MLAGGGYWDSASESQWLKKLENGKNWYKTGHWKVLSVYDLLLLPATAGEIT